MHLVKEMHVIFVVALVETKYKCLCANFSTVLL